MRIDDGEYNRRLNALMEAALEAPDLASMTRVMAGRMAAVTGADACYITFYETELSLVTPVAVFGTTAAWSGGLDGFALQPDEPSLTREVVLSNKTLVIENALSSSQVGRRVIETQKARAFIGVPIETDGKVLGAIILGFNKPRTFSARELARCEHASRFASFAISRVQLLEEERHRSGELAALNRIGMAINADRNFDRVINTIFEQCRGIIALDTFYLALYDEEREELRFPLFYDNGEILDFNPRCIRDKPGLSGHIIKTRAPICLPDASTPEIHGQYNVVRAGGAVSRAYIGVPLLYGERVLGVMSVQSYRASVYTSHHVRLMETIAAQSAIAIENARLYGELELRSITDGLTGAFNYRYLSDIGPRELAKAARHGRTVSLLFFDVDKFRDFNSRHGHSTGNEVLKVVATHVFTCIRQSDIFGRYGGEEFVVILPETPPEEAFVIAERIRSSIEALRIRRPGQDDELGVTISVGVASSAAGVPDFQALVDQANGAERLAKRRGRNRVERAWD